MLKEKKLLNLFYGSILIVTLISVVGHAVHGQLNEGSRPTTTLNDSRGRSPAIETESVIIDYSEYADIINKNGANPISWNDLELNQNIENSLKNGQSTGILTTLLGPNVMSSISLLFIILGLPALLYAIYTVATKELHLNQKDIKNYKWGKSELDQNQDLQSSKNVIPFKSKKELEGENQSEVEKKKVG